MPVVGLPLDELFRYLGREFESEAIEHELHRFGCSVEGWADVVRYRCESCGAIVEGAAGELPPPFCDACGADLRAGAGAATELSRGRVLRMELLAVRPDLFDVPGLARALRGFFGLEEGAPRYALEGGETTIEVDPALAGPRVVRPRIVAATIHGLRFDDGALRSLMKLQENIHWALGRDRKLASIGVYDLQHVTGRALRYRAAERDGVRFVPLGFDPRVSSHALTPAEILARHPKGRAFSWLLEDATLVPLLEDEAGGVLSMPPIINSEATRVTHATTDVLVDVTGLADRHIERALAIVVASLLETCPDAVARTVTVRYGADARVTPDLEPQAVTFDPVAAGRLIGVPWTGDEAATLLRRMRHDVDVVDDLLRVYVPAWRADILHPRDLVEDCAIAYGYDRIEHVTLARATFGSRHPREELMGRTRRALVGQGFLEVMTLALSSEDATYGKTGLPAEDRHVVLKHPISVEQTMVRVSTIPGLMETLAINLGHPYPQRICEIGLVSRVEAGSETGAHECAMAAFALAGDGFGFADVRATVDALLREFGTRTQVELAIRPFDAPLFLPGRGAAIWKGDARIGIFGEVHPAVLERYRVIHPVAIGELEIEAI